MLFPPLESDYMTISKPNAFAICDGMLRTAHCLIVGLPEPELREIRHTLDRLLMRADRALDLIEVDFSLTFEGLEIDSDIPHPPGAEDFGAVLVGRAPVPATARRLPPVPTTTPVHSPTLAPEPQPATALTPPNIRNHHPLILSTRDGVGLPDYTHHPRFVRPGIPGTYLRPPTPSGQAFCGPYFVVTRGLYVGIFNTWTEVKPWVFGISGSLYRKVPSWGDARELYNTRLAAGRVQVVA